MAMRHLASLLLGLFAASAAMPGNALAQQPVTIGESISLTGAYAKPGVYGLVNEDTLFPKER